MISSLRERETKASRKFEGSACRRRTDSLQISHTAAIPSVHEGGLTCLSLELIESRYLLGAATDSSFAIYDTAQASAATSASSCCLCKVDRTKREGHKYSVSCATWYPIDSGLFVTGSWDWDVKVWDANVLQAACTFSFPQFSVHAVAMSSCATGHCLIAATTASPEVRLCDPNSGSFSHSLTGHTDGVWAAAWSLQNEWELITGGCDGQARLWDIRAPGAVRLLNQHQTERKRDRKGRSRQWPVRAADHATAHEGSITAVVPTDDGLHWLTAGTDSRIRLWDSHNLRNLLINYKQSINRASKARQIAVAGSAGLLFHPSGSIIQAFDILTGQQKYVLKGHMDAVNACYFNETTQELYTGANDHQICIWSCPSRERDDRNKDNWSP